MRVLSQTACDEDFETHKSMVGFGLKTAHVRQRLSGSYRLLRNK